MSFNSNSRCLTSVAALTLAVFFTAGLAHGQANDIKWRSGPQAIAIQDSTQSAAQISSELDAGRSHMIVQFDAPLSAADRQQLNAAGVEVLDYLSNNAYFAKVSPQRFNAAGLTQIQVAMSATPVDSTHKLHPMLDAGEVAPWAIVEAKLAANPDVKEGSIEAASELIPENPTVAAYVLFHRDVRSTDRGAALVQMYGGSVQSELQSVNGLVVHLPFDEIRNLVAEDDVMWIEPPLPALTPTNNSNRARTGAETAQAAPYGLDGTGVTVLVYDGGTADASHPDFGGRLTIHDSSGTSYHATHVAGTIGGSGASSSGTYRGMAPGVTIESYGFEQAGGLQEGFLYTDPGDLEADYGEAINLYGADISNNSIGSNTAPNGFPCDWEGNYGVTAATIDGVVRGSVSGAPFRIVWSNGNERGSGRCGTTYVTTAPPACAKNHITVGALNSNDNSVTSFTSWGPTDDGRIKPDVSGPGCQSNDDNGVTSCDSGGGYTTLCGTSMSGPTVCGVGALILQDYRLEYPGEPDFRNSTLKALLAHTAVDLGNAGPDYQVGYGSVRAIPAIEMVRAGNFLEAEVDQGGFFSALVYVNPDDTELKVTIAWDDPPGVPNVNPNLVNDLDLHVYGPDNTRYYPWTLNPASPSTPAVRNQEDHVNNIEQVYINAPAPGAYRVEVHGFAVPQGPQIFSLTGSPLLINCSSQGTASLNQQMYACESTATLRVVDCDLNTDDLVIDTVSVVVTSTTESAGETVILTETSAESATFDASLPLSEIDGTGILQIAEGDTVTLTYIDADDGLGGTNVTVTSTASVDCTSPVISNVVIAEINPRDALITFDTDEPATVSLSYGLGCGALTDVESATGYNTSHSIRISGLTDATAYFLTIDAADQAGNLATDDNGGLCYTFTTPDIPNFFTEQFTGSFDLANKSMTFVPNSSVDFYAACIEPIVALPTSPTGGTTITLTDDDSELISLGGSQVSIYGSSYASIYVGSNGYITFGESDTTTGESFANHFDAPRVSALFDDLNPSTGGSVSYKLLTDRIAVTYENVPEYSSSNQNTFQIELYFDGTIVVSYLNIDSTDSVVGLSEGLGVDVDFLPTDLSEIGSCGPRPPIASGANVQTDIGMPVLITLLASDDGLPNPPAAITLSIASLPAHGTIREPNGPAITAVPALLSGDEIEYTPDPWYGGPDSFTFTADDGGTPPDGGESNPATIDITVGGPQLVYDYPLDSNPGWTTEGKWAFGVPLGNGSNSGDPTSGHTGSFVYGYNLAGDYSNSMPKYNLTTTSIDCTEMTDTELRFWRWLGVESSTYDNAAIEVSASGSAWVTIWEHDSSSFSESSWSQHVFDISDIADGNVIQIRWSMGTTDGSVTYPGWNIDDVEIWGIVPVTPPCDIDDDGDCDMADAEALMLCIDGPNVSVSSGCELSDLDSDTDADMADFATYCWIYSGQ
jgi:hypothetical protein